MANAIDQPPTLDCRARALALWPGLDRARLRRTGGDPVRVARLVGHRTTLPIEAILGLLTGGAVEAPARASDPDRGPS